MSHEDLSRTRHTLLQRLKDVGDDDSWRDLFETYWRLIYTTAVRAGLTPEEAEEVVQETILNVVKHIIDFKVGSTHGSFKSWLLTMTRWRITDQFRKRPKHLRVPNSAHSEPTTAARELEEVPDPGSLDPDAKWEADWRQTLLEAAIARLKLKVDPKDYQVFDLHVMQSWPGSKVASLLGIKPALVYRVKYRLTGLLDKEIKRLEDGDVSRGR